MNIQAQVNKIIGQNMGTLGGEPITIDSTTFNAVIDQETRTREIMGGSRVEREITAEFPTDETLTLKVGSIVHARSKKWKIETVRKGQSMTNITLIEPNRASE